LAIWEVAARLAAARAANEMASMSKSCCSWPQFARTLPAESIRRAVLTPALIKELTIKLPAFSWVWAVITKSTTDISSTFSGLKIWFGKKNQPLPPEAVVAASNFRQTALLFFKVTPSRCK
jgi:hypothetical protein